MSISADKLNILNALKNGLLRLQGQFLNSSNYTFLGDLEYQTLKIPVVYKPVKGERPLWDFPRGTLAKRETAAFIISEALGWNLVPPTVFREVQKYGPGSIQVFIEHEPEDHFFNFSAEDRQRLKPVALFDALINNADRKAGHILRGENNMFWLIDHGVCFHQEDKLRTVIWDFAGEWIPKSLLKDLGGLLEKETIRPVLQEQLHAYLSIQEINALAVRTLRYIQTGCFPAPSEEYPSYPWPPV